MDVLLWKLMEHLFDMFEIFRLYYDGGPAPVIPFQQDQIQPTFWMVGCFVYNNL